METILFVSPGSCSLGALVAYEWSGLPYKVCVIRHHTDHEGKKSYRQINPLGQTPALRIGDDMMVQSLAIFKHLARQSSDPRIVPRSDGEANRMDMILGFLHTSFFSAYIPLWMAMGGMPGREVLSSTGQMLVGIAHDQLETLLGDREWLVGDRATIADAYFAGLVRWNDLHQAIDMDVFPKIQALRARVDNLPAIKFGKVVEDEKLAGGDGGFRGFVTPSEAAIGVRGFV